MESSHRHDPQARPQPRLMDQVRNRIRRLGLAPRTEVAYCGWIARFIEKLGAESISYRATTLNVQYHVSRADHALRPIGM